MLTSKDKSKILKKLLCFFLTFLLSIESFAAIVSDNDGSSFVTKSEFESLKQNFADQITNYNDSIDKKIDGAIANYLAGINVEKKSSVPLLHELKNVSLGQGYRAYNVSTLSERVGDLGKWFINNVIAVARAGRWLNIADGVVSAIYKSQNLSDYYSFNPAPYGYIEGNDPPWRVSSYTTGARYQLWTIVTQHSGTLKPDVTENNRPIIFVNSNGIMTSFDNTRLEIIDRRTYRAGDWPTSFGRGTYLVGVVDEYPSFGSYRFNTDYEIAGRGGTVKNGNVYFEDSVGACYGNLVSPTISYNKNLFCWNLTDSTLIDVFDTNKGGYYINSKVKTSTQDARSEITQTMLAEGPGLSQNGDGPSSVTYYVSKPEVRLDPAAYNTTLANSCFSSVTNDYYPRLKMQHLKNDGMYDNDETTNTYIYQGLPFFKPDKNGKLEFEIKINTNYNSSSYYFVDPGNTSSEICLRVKSTPFGIGADTANAVKMQIGGSTTEVEEAKITRGTKTKITIKCEAKKTYFLRWYVDGYLYGGEITYLGDGFFTETDDI